MIKVITFLFKETRPKCLAYLPYCRNDLMLLLLVLFLISQEFKTYWYSTVLKDHIWMNNVQGV